jgi:hypothetical protein
MTRETNYFSFVATNQLVKAGDEKSCHLQRAPRNNDVCRNHAYSCKPGRSKTVFFEGVNEIEMKNAISSIVLPKLGKNRRGWR